MFWWHPLQHWLAVHTGSSGMPGVAANYNFWSGFGSDLGEITLLAAVLGLWHRHQCHTKGCWRIGRHVVAGTPWCNRHHGGARVILAAGADTAPPFGAIERKLDKLSDDISGLAEAIRAAVAPVRAGAGSNPAEEGLPADATAAVERVVPPAAARKGRK